MALSLSLNKANYAAGETMTLTVTTAPDERDVYHDEPIGGHVDIPGLGYSGNLVGTVTRNTGTFQPIQVVDPARTWTFVSDDGNVAKYTATA